MNLHALGIEICSDGNHYTDEQREAVRTLLEYLIDLYVIPVNNIIRHKDYTSRKRDVGDTFWNNDYDSFDQYQQSFKKNDTEGRRLVHDGIRNGQFPHEPSTRLETALMVDRMAQMLRLEASEKSFEQLEWENIPDGASDDPDYEYVHETMPL